MCPSGNPAVPASKAPAASEFSVPVSGREGLLRITVKLRYRKIDQFLLNYTLGERSGLTAPVVDIASATARVCVVRRGESAACQ